MTLIIAVFAICFAVCIFRTLQWLRWRVLTSRAVAKYKLGYSLRAIADFDRAIELKPEEAEAYYNRGVAKSKLGDQDGAEADRKRAIELDPALK